MTVQSLDSRGPSQAATAPAQRVLHVIPTYAPAWRYGGPIRALHALVQAQRAVGLDARVLTTSADGASDLAVPTNRWTEYEGVPVRYVRCGLGRRIYRAPEMLGVLHEELQRVDCVHLHSLFLWPTAMAARAARRSGVPYLLSPRGMLVPSLFRARSGLAKRIWWRCEGKRQVEGAARLLYTAALERQEALQFSFREPAFAVVPNGVEREAFGAQELALDPQIAERLPKRPFVIAMGRIEPKKGLERAVSALCHLPQCELVLVGPDERGTVAALEAQARRLGVSDRLHGLGALDGDERFAVLSRARLLTLPSHQENFGNAVTEAMAAGVPVVTTQDVGAAALVEAASAGLVVNGDPSEIAAAWDVYLRCASTAEAAGRRGQVYAANMLGWERIAERLSAEYAQACAAARP